MEVVLLPAFGKFRRLNPQVSESVEEAFASKAHAKASKKFEKQQRSGRKDISMEVLV